MYNAENILDYKDWNGLFVTSKEVISDILESSIIPDVNSADYEKFLNKLLIRTSYIDLKDFFTRLKVDLDKLKSIDELFDYFSNYSNFSSLYSYYRDIPKIRRNYLEVRDLFIEFELDLEGNYIPVINEFYKLQLKNLDSLEKNINKLLKIFLGVLLSSEDFVMPYEL